MRSVSIYNNERSSGEFVSSKKINVSDQVQILLQIACPDSRRGSFIENTVIDLILTHFRSAGTDTYADFGYLLEKLNKYLKEISKNEQLSDLNIFLGILDDSILHFSILGEVFAYLVKGGKVMNISEGMGGRLEIPQFGYISSGKIESGDAINISNDDLLNIFTQEDLSEISRLNRDGEKIETIASLLAREIPNKPTHLITISNHEEKRSSWEKHPTYGIYLSQTKKYYGVAANILAWFIAEASKNEWVKIEIERLRELINTKNRTIRSVGFGIGIIVCVGLLYLILSSLFVERANTSVPEEYKNKLIEAQLIIEKSNKDVGNREVFNANLKRAEELIFAVRDKQIFLNDVKKLLADISILKKQMNGIETFVVQDSKAEYLFADKNFAIENIFEISKKFYFVGKNAIIGPYLKGTEAKIYPYPDGEEAVSSDTTSEGYVYIFTKSGRLLRFYKGEFAYVNVEGQKTWEKGKEIRMFNSNLYMLGEDGTQIYKHKPGVSGFSMKSELIRSEDLGGRKILDFGIDGGFYIIKDDLTMDKVFTTPSYTRRSVVLNGLPENYAIEPNSTDPRVFIAANLNYLYLVLNNQIWIFSPDTRNYKDVKSLKYVGQIEFGDEQVRSILVTKDGTVTAGTDRGIYTVNFEVSDGKVIMH